MHYIPSCNSYICLHTRKISYQKFTYLKNEKRKDKIMEMKLYLIFVAFLEYLSLFFGFLLLFLCFQVSFYL